jgi:hypothetical protein
MRVFHYCIPNFSMTSPILVRTMNIHIMVMMDEHPGWSEKAKMDVAALHPNRFCVKIPPV